MKQRWQRLLEAARALLVDQIDISDHKNDAGEWYDTSAGLARAISAITGEDFGQPPDDYTEDDWRLEVANGDTVLGFAEWLEHKRESDEHDAEQEAESELI